MNINIITLFPEIFEALNFGLLGQAIGRQDIKINTYNLRDHQINKHGQVDDKPYGGGAGMVLMAEPLEKSLKDIPVDEVGKVINLSPQGTLFNHKKAKELSLLKSITIIAGRYEGIDERFISQYIDEEISIGDFVLSGGEFAALNLIDSISRFIPGVIGNKASVEQDSLSQGFLKGPVFTRPENFNSESVPEILLSGDHEKIQEWKDVQALKRTFERRPELLKSVKLTKKQKKLLEDLASKRIL
ncbi:tRNA (guanosine(37)-N1)-methyltransferase TrmD [Gammaproteobacteria bacterium]|jgi:tRNA (guanine37-N1)-methyltransferase|nr:tRNA (guanosine(37)-N1)-methyltransferase TrmD [Gammaproteobacteria bacterium]MDB2356991.1 tRNA (guanosine(37)-N1)-methyltransferase TrmD [Gammaproteobacteria bacterium]MDB2510953.1 tRNA (guanosine(37)-N1)-methyltransferase TrmD [Gammaproteobacteria bacterium]MDB2628790.1 tRNA (guanosine(37)-N1)-methyltransferase TrmD [Gammaproteobacteria bacterium]